MTTAQREQLNRFLAEKVLGKHGEALLADYVGDWNSCQFLLDKIEREGWCWKMGFTIFNSERWYWFEMETYHPQYRPTYKVSNQPSRTDALCLAIARAYGWKEEV